MAHSNPGDQELRQLLIDATVIAMVGASSSPEKKSHRIMRKLQHAGCRVIPVNPNCIGATHSLLQVPRKTATYA